MAKREKIISVFLIICSVIYMIFPIIVISSYRSINSWETGICFYNETATEFDVEDKWYSTIEIKTQGQVDEKFYSITIEWPPGGSWYTQKNIDDVRDFEVRYKSKNIHDDCKIDIENSEHRKTAVLENISQSVYIGWILGLITGIILVMVSAFYVYYVYKNP